MTGAAVCTAHKGRHGVYLGNCVAMGRDVPRPYTFRPSVCETCGADIDLRRSAADGTTERLVAGTDRRHQHAPPVAVTFDPDELAGAIVAASRAARQERQPEPRPSSVPPQVSQRQEDAERQIHGVEVVRPD